MPQNLSEADIFANMIERIRLAEEASYIIGHFYKAQDDFEYGQGFLAVGEMLKMTTINLTNLATKAMRTKVGLK